MNSTHLAPIRAIPQPTRRQIIAAHAAMRGCVYARCCNYTRFGRFCSECGKALVQRKRRKVRVVMVQPDGRRIPFDSIGLAVEKSGLTRRAIDWALLGNERPDGTKWERVAA